MFNSPILDVVIGLVFVFLLYSLLATSIKEAIATAFGLRASMLKKGIVDGMLSDSPPKLKVVSVFKGILNFILGILDTIGLIPVKKEVNKKIGDKFYDHPIIKNYGSSRIFPFPSYIPADNFSTVLIDVLKQDFINKLGAIAEYKKQVSQSPDTKETIMGNILYSADPLKIKDLLDYYESMYQSGKSIPNGIIDKETCQILQMHLRSSVYDIKLFSKKLEDWFNDSMDRVSGWYKRQVQVILFIIGICMAILFNVDTIEIAGKLSTDKDARDKMVQLAMKASEQYKDDPRVQLALKNDTAKANLLINGYQQNLDQAKKTLDSGINNANQVLAIGWDAYGRQDSLFLKTLQDKIWVGPFYIDHTAKKYDSMNIKNDRPLDSVAAFYQYQYRNYPLHVKTAYVWYVISSNKKKLLGFLITAFAICLGAPFWFDMLNKLVKLRGSGKKEETCNIGIAPSNNPQQQPLNVNVNTQKSGEEAVG